MSPIDREPRTLADLPAPDESTCRHLLAVFADVRGASDAVA